MAIYRFERKIISRSEKAKGKNLSPDARVSVVRNAAYISGEKLRDERIGKDFDYRSKQKGIEAKGIELPEQALEWQGEREKLWNAIEKVEKRKDSQLAYLYIITLPREFSKEEMVAEIKGWCKERTDKGFICDWGLHREEAKDGGENWHAHILQTTRPVDVESASGFGKKPDNSGKFNGRGKAGIGIKDELKAEREAWEKQANAALEAAGHSVRISCLSREDRGLDGVGQPKIGPAASAMKKRGKLADTQAHKNARRVELYNELEPYLHDREKADTDAAAKAARRAERAKQRRERKASLYFHDRQVGRGSSMASRDALHDVDSGKGRGVYTTSEARDRAAHTPPSLKSELAPYIRAAKQGRELQPSSSWIERTSEFMRLAGREYGQAAKETAAALKGQWTEYVASREAKRGPEKPREPIKPLPEKWTEKMDDKRDLHIEPPLSTWRERESRRRGKDIEPEP